MLAVTVALPTVVPPVVQMVGAVVWGPNTVKVIVAVGLAPPVSVALSVEAAIALTAVPLAGAVMVVVVAFLIVVRFVNPVVVVHDAL